MTHYEVVRYAKKLESQTLQMHEVDQLKRLMFGSKRERFIPSKDENQLTLSFEVSKQEEPKTHEAVVTYN